MTPNPVAQPDPLIGQVIAGKFEVQARLGAGAMGIVYRAQQVSLERTVAIKVLHRELAADVEIAARFWQEARAASRLDHPNSIRVFDFGQESDGLLYLAMEYLEGSDLFDWVEQHGRPSAESIIQILLQVLAALAVAHDMAVVHRDLKPENILIVRAVGDDGQPVELVKVCDFGIAKILDAPAVAPRESERRHSTSGLITGTPAYLSPEQARGENQDARSDIYSTGVVLYELLTGRVPFYGETLLAVALKHVSDEPDPPSRLMPDVDPDLEAICLKALSKNPLDRFQSAREMRLALQEAAANLGFSTRPSIPAGAPWSSAAHSLRSEPPRRHSSSKPTLPSLAPSALAPSALLPSALLPSALAPSALAPSALAPSALAPSALPPSSLAPSALAPSALAPSALPPSALPPSAAAPGKSEPRAARSRGWLLPSLALGSALLFFVFRSLSNSSRTEPWKSSRVAVAPLEGVPKVIATPFAAQIEPSAAPQLIEPMPSTALSYPASSAAPRIDPKWTGFASARPASNPALAFALPGTSTATVLPTLVEPDFGAASAASSNAPRDASTPAPRSVAEGARTEATSPTPIASVTTPPAASSPKLPDNRTKPTPTTSAVLPAAEPALPAYDLATARVLIGLATNAVGATAASATRAVSAASARITACYKAALPRLQSPIGGSGLLHVDTDGSGIIIDAHLSGPIRGTVASCIASAVQGRRMANVDTGSASADVPLSFRTR